MSIEGYVLLDLVERYPQRLLAAVPPRHRAEADDSARRQKRTMLATKLNGSLLRRSSRYICPGSVCAADGPG